MRIAHVLASVDDPGAGPSYSVPALARGMAKAGEEVVLHTVAGWRAGGPGPEDLSVHRHPQDFERVPGLGRLALSRDLQRALAREARRGGVLHGHGLWLMPNVYPARAVAGTQAKWVLSPRGMLGGAALRFSAGRKAAIWRVMQRRAAAAAHCLHATADAEYQEIRAAGLTAPVAIIPNGVDLPHETGAAERTRTVLSLGRVHPKKGLPNLLQAWRDAGAEALGWRLRIVGPDEGGHTDELRAQVIALGLARATIEGPLHGSAKDAAFAQASLFVLPSLNENFAMTVAEALAAGLPVIATQGAPWNGLENHACGWWVGAGAAPIATALVEALSLPPTQLAAMGAKGRAWMAAEFSWDGRAAEMLKVYRWLREGGAAPRTIRLD